VLAANETLAAAFDTSEAELVGRHVTEVLPENVANQWLAYGDDALASGQRVSFESSHDGTHYHTIVVPITLGTESDTVQVLSRDITDRIEYQRELEETTEELELINRFVRHDIRNDINLVYAWAGALEAHVDEEGREYIERIRSTSDHITELTQIAGEFVETVSGSGEVELNAVDLRQALSDELQKCRQSYERATFQVNDTIPAVNVHANGMLSSVFRNLLNNAVQHNDGDHPQVYVSVSVGEEAVTVTVADDGPGIPDEQKDGIFGKGEQGAESSGSGIGLYLVYTLVSEYGGRVRAEDSDIGGARFVVELPLADP
jgi:signal transduction histidine kinase